MTFIVTDVMVGVLKVQEGSFWGSVRGGLTLKSLEFGLFGASKSKVNTFLNLKVTEFSTGLLDLLKNDFYLNFSMARQSNMFFFGYLKNRK